MMSEFTRDLRMSLVDSLLAPANDAKRNPVSVCALHRDALELDALFYAHLAVWYQTHGQVRSLRDVFVAALFSSPHAAHREAGWVLLQRLPPAAVAHVAQLCKAQFGKAPRCLKSAVDVYLRKRERDPLVFDRAALRNAADLKSLYAGFHLRPCPRAQQILFTRRPPAESLAARVKSLARCTNPEEQALGLLDLRLPMPVALGVMRGLTPSTLAALVELMTPAEVMNHLAMLRKRGALQHPELRARVEARLGEARGDRRVSDYRALQAAAHVDDEALRLQLEEVHQGRVAARGAIRRSTAVLVDKSGSMDQAIALGVRLAALTAGLMQAPLEVLAFDTLAFPIVPAEVAPAPSAATVADWERAFAPVRAGGSTSVGAGVAWLRRFSKRVEQLVIITDEEENSSPYLVPELQAYGRELGYVPHIMLLKTRGATDHLERELRKAQIGFDAYQFTGDYFALSNLIPMLTRPSRFDLLLEILDTPLPARRSQKPAARSA